MNRLPFPLMAVIGRSPPINGTPASSSLDALAGGKRLLVAMNIAVHTPLASYTRSVQVQK